MKVTHVAGRTEGRKVTKEGRKDERKDFKDERKEWCQGGRKEGRSRTWPTLSRKAEFATVDGGRYDTTVRTSGISCVRKRALWRLDSRMPPSISSRDDTKCMQLPSSKAPYGSSSAQGACGQPSALPRKVLFVTTTVENAVALTTAPYSCPTLPTMTPVNAG